MYIFHSKKKRQYFHYCHFQLSRPHIGTFIIPSRESLLSFTLIKVKKVIETKEIKFEKEDMIKAMLNMLL